MYAQGTTPVKKGILPSSLAVSGVRRSEFQACAEIESVAFDAFADVEVVDPTFCLAAVAQVTSDARLIERGG